ncbi:hypothetical protein Btru_028300 [Bulinus truncatus]|nr:hypothetical protein Btru_028300 [Bulinus truncatus]
MAASMDISIQQYFVGDSKDAAKQLAAELNKSSAIFLKFIESLESYITSTENVTRGRATQMIGDVIDLLPIAFLTSEQAEVVARFLLVKLSDHHSVQPHALASLAVLTKRCKELPVDLPEDICRTIFREIQNQTLSHSDRRATYGVFQNLLGSSNKALEQMGGDFIIGFIQQMDAEKDPRNLLICFNIAHYIITNMRLGPFTEEMFEVLGCYFPIDFIPPPNDPHGISKDDLVKGLRRCLAATADFAEYCLPLLLEKMTSDLQEARKEAMFTLVGADKEAMFTLVGADKEAMFTLVGADKEAMFTLVGADKEAMFTLVGADKEAMFTLIECAPVYGSHLVAYLGSLNSTLKREILMNISNDLVNAAKDAIAAVYAAIKPADGVDNSKNDEFASSIVELYQDTVKYLDGSDTKKSSLAFSMFQSIAASSPSAFRIITPLILPSLLSHFSKLSSAAEQLLYIKELKGFLTPVKNFNTHKDAVKVIKDNLSALLHLYEEKLNKSENTDIQLESIEGLSIITSPSLCDEFGMAEHFAQTLINKSIQETDLVLRQSILSSLHNVVVETPDLGSNLIDVLVQKSISSPIQHILETMVHVVIDEPLFQKVSQFLLQKISQVQTDNVSEAVECVHSLTQLLEKMHSNAACVDIFLHTIVPQLLSTSVTISSQWTEESRDKCASFMSEMRNIFKVTSQYLTKSGVAVLWDKLTRLLIDSDTLGIGIVGDFPIIKSLQPDSPWQQTRLITLLEGFVTGGNIQAMVDNREKIFESLFILTLESEDEFTRTSACRCVAVIFNKVPIGGEIHWLLEPMVDRLKQAMSHNRPLANRLRALNTFIWLAKALECRGHSATAILSSHLFTMLDDAELGSEVAVGLGLIVQDMNDIFNPALQANVTPLYKQRFFSLNIKSLLEGFKKNKSTDKRQHYLTAVSCITSNLPLQILKPLLAQLVPLLLLCLEQSSTNLCHTLITLSSAILNAPELVAPSVDDLVTRLLDLACTQTDMKVRISALKCLENLTTLPIHTLTPVQPRVVRDLSLPLDDKKRLVRKQAVDTRCAWILLEKNKK